MTAPDDDWRLTNQLSYLRGATLVWRDYVPPSDSWDHDHCEFCFAKFMSPGGAAEAETAGYVSSDERWICGRCFGDFRERFEWRVA